MNEIKLIDLLKIIVSKEGEEDEDYDIIKSWYLKRIEVYGKSNLHIPYLEIHGDEDPYCTKCEERTKENNNLLTGEEIVKGKYLVYSCGGHDGTETIVEYDNLEEVENYLLNFYDNNFINSILVFEDNQVKDWKVEGPPNTVEFIDEEIENGIIKGVAKTIIRAEIKWLN